MPDTISSRSEATLDKLRKGYKESLDRLARLTSAIKAYKDAIKGKENTEEAFLRFGENALCAEYGKRLTDEFRKHLSWTIGVVEEGDGDPKEDTLAMVLDRNRETVYRAMMFDLTRTRMRHGDDRTFAASCEQKARARHLSWLDAVARHA